MVGRDDSDVAETRMRSVVITTTLVVETLNCGPRRSIAGELYALNLAPSMH